MPPVSEAQRRWAWANKDRPNAEGKAAAEYAAADHGGKLPGRSKKKKRHKSGEERDLAHKIIKRLSARDRD